MNMKMDFKIDLKKFLNGNILRRIFTEFFFKKMKLFALLVIFFSALFLVFLWEGYIFRPQWDEARVQEYTKTKQNKSDAIFNKGSFEKIVEESNARNAEFEKLLGDLTDIFRLNK